MFTGKPEILLLIEFKNEPLLFENILGKLDVDITKAYSANEALECLAQREYAAIILDTEMACVNAIECTEAIRGIKKNRDIPIMFLLPFGSECKYSLENFDAVDFIFQPIANPGMVLGKIKFFIEFYLQRKKLEEQTAMIQEQVIQLEEREQQFENELIERMRVEEEIINQNLIIMDSINYASIIQKSLLPDTEALKSHMTDLLIIWQPRDIVGGDFYWFMPLYDGFITAVIDCTGHGVPGAFMTIAVSQMLKRIVDEGRAFSPASILNTVDQNIKDSFYREKVFEKIHLGLDMGICRVDLYSNTIIFSGAKIPLYHISSGRLSEISCSKRSVGYSLGFDKGKKEEYRNIEISYRPGDMFYMASDGITDQNGSENEFPIGSEKFKQCLVENCSLSMDGQKQALLQMLKDYMGLEEQRDDITVLGFMLK